jgi:gamma-glutamyl:cysteine ligase YbdK (ATP-grasp superfamily)
MSDLPLLGVEEEFHVVDLETRRSAPEVDALLSQLDGDEFAPSCSARWSRPTPRSAPRSTS